MSPAPGTAPQFHLQQAFDNLYDRCAHTDRRLLDALHELRGPQPAQVAENQPAPDNVVGKMDALGRMLDRMEDHAAEIQRLVGQHGADEGAGSAGEMRGVGR